MGVPNKRAVTRSLALRVRELGRMFRREGTGGRPAEHLRGTEHELCLQPSARGVTVSAMEVTDTDVAAIPPRNVPDTVGAHCAAVTARSVAERCRNPSALASAASTRGPGASRDGLRVVVTARSGTTSIRSRRVRRERGSGRRDRRRGRAVPVDA
ncbi:hypothetical protein GCM10023199_05060 [Actinomycetospora chibensis]